MSWLWWYHIFPANACLLPCVQDPATVSEVLDKSLHLIPDAVLDAPPSEPVLEEVDAQPHWSLATLDFPQPVARAGVNQTPVGAAARAAALAEQAAEEAEAAAKAQAAGGAPAMAVAGCGEGLGAEGEGVSACAMEAMMEEQAEAVEAKKEKKQKAACVVS